MKHVIAILENALATATNNEPINRGAGNIEQADLEAATAAEIREALTILEPPTDFNERVRLEQKQLSKNIVKLSAFLESKQFRYDLTDGDRALLRRQHAIMLDYDQVLTERIEGFR